MAWSDLTESTPSFPPLFSGQAAENPFPEAIAAARSGTDAGLLTHRIRPDHLSAALVLAPECPLEDAMAMVLAAGNGFADAFGALAPSEIACQFDWPGEIRINGGRAGRIRASASSRETSAVPGWLVVGLDLRVFENAGAEPGATPDSTTLWDEGCSEIAPRDMLEAWARHTLFWIHEWLDTGIAKLHRDWLGRAFAKGEAAMIRLPGDTLSGIFTGLDEKGGLLLTSDGTTRLIPLTAMLEDAS